MGLDPPTEFDIALSGSRVVEETVENKHSRPFSDGERMSEEISMDLRTWNSGFVDHDSCHKLMQVIWGRELELPIFMARCLVRCTDGNCDTAFMWRHSC